ncbi:hypothetical protein NK718_07905 [Alsobacter sp. SYSU M60028]|uniref:Mannosyltransferase n=1 Tax=Alsobacter ponti TaxID=2962936 RepID=A0ABT1LAC3_9HYPH|nr:hypothetical protein [Alsobacter ponti]
MRRGWDGPDAALVALLGLALALRLAAAFALPNIVHPDEIFQTLEPAHRLWTGWGLVTWEWRAGIRSWLFPGFLAGMMTGLGALGASWPVVLGAIVVVLAIVSLAVVAVGYRVGRETFGPRGALIVGWLCAVWPDLVYFAPKTLTEVVAAHTLIVATWLANAPALAPVRGGQARGYVGLGLLLGLTFCLRFHLAPALLIVAIWACRMDVRRRWLPVVAGGLAVLAVSGALDWLTLGSPSQSIWKNIAINLFEGRSQDFGVSHAGAYVVWMSTAWGPAAWLVLIAFVFGARSAPLFALVAGSIWLVHSAIPHKEVRFLFPATPCIIIVAGVGCARLLEWWGKTWPFPRSRAATAGVLAVWTAAAASAATGPDYRGMWVGRAPELAAEAALRNAGDLCGVALAGLNWFDTGGYTHLHRPVFLYLYDQPYDERPDKRRLGDAEFSSFNYLIAPPDIARPPGYAQLGCEGEVCVYRRPGGCTPSERDEANRAIEALDP